MCIAIKCRENNWYCTVYTYKYRGKHVYMYSTSLEHNACDIENLHASIVACCVSVLFLQTSACWLLDQTHALTTLVLYLEHQLTSPHSVLFPITAVAPPPHTLGPAQTEATSQPQPSMSVWEAARKWAMYCLSMHESMCVTLFCFMFLLFSAVLLCLLLCVCVHVCVCARAQHSSLSIY